MRRTDLDRPAGTEDHVTWQERLTEFVGDRGPALVGYARLLTGDQDDAQDLVQDALVKAWSRRGAGSEITSIEGYVRRTVLTLYLDRYRRRRRWQERVHLLVTPEEVPAPDTGSARSLDVAAALATLAPRERACVVLRFYDDLTVAEIGTRLGVSDGAVKRYLSDGTRRLGPLLGSSPSHETLDVHVQEDRR
jgi:RNA polymerase sigma-70 factor (ECF subfamily)